MGKTLAGEEHSENGKSEIPRKGSKGLLECLRKFANGL